MKVDLLNGKLNKTYFTMLFSAIASTIVTTIYSTVDMICIGHYAGPDGAASVACANPLWALMFAFGVKSTYKPAKDLLNIYITCTKTSFKPSRYMARSTAPGISVKKAT